LTLVLTPGAAPAKSFWTELDYASPEDAQLALAGREGSPVHWIGLWPGSQPRHPVGQSNIVSWASAAALDAVVWTALPPRFNGADNRAPIGPSEAVTYLKGLSGEAQARAREYIVRAPALVRTQFRAAFEADLGWLPEPLPGVD
jgi:hypothetical protein